MTTPATSPETCPPHAAIRGGGALITKRRAAHPAISHPVQPTIVPTITAPTSAATITVPAADPPAVNVWPSCSKEVAYTSPSGQITQLNRLTSRDGVISWDAVGVLDGAEDYRELDLTRPATINGENALGVGFRQLSVRSSEDGPSITLGGKQYFYMTATQQEALMSSMRGALGDSCIDPVKIMERPIPRSQPGAGVEGLFLH